jgi:hypothetical protein
MERLGKALKPGMPGASGGVTYLKGMDVVMSNLNTQLNGIKTRSMKGLIMSAAFIRTQTEHEEPLTPVDYGNLRASWFVTTAAKPISTKGPSTFRGPNASKIAEQKASAMAEGQGEVARLDTKDKKFLMMGYGANYAGFVHEFIPGIANFKRPGAREKWLQSHLYKNTAKIVQIIKENSQIKG